MHIFSKLFHGEMHKKYGNMLKKFQQILVILFKKLASITYNRLPFFSRFVHPLASIFYGEIHKDGGNKLIFF